jgi:hypothetical protein
LSAFAFISIPFLAFFIYDRKISRQQEKILSNALRTDAIISDLFPSNVRDQLYKSLRHSNENDNDNTNDVIAEFHPETTVLFADIVDFTVWCSSK